MSSAGVWLPVFLACLANTVFYTLNVSLIAVTKKGGYLSPPHYMLFCNIKLASTSGLFRVVMGKKISVLQWLALALVIIGLSVISLGGKEDGTDALLEKENTENLLVGLLLVTAISCCSAAAGVASEYTIKQFDNMHVPASQAYLVGVAIMIVCVECGGVKGEKSPVEKAMTMSTGSTNGGLIPAATVLIQSTVSELKNRFESGESLFIQRSLSFVSENWSMGRIVVWLTILSHASIGLAVSALFRFGDIIIKMFTVALSTVWTTLIERYFFGFSIAPSFVLGYMICLIATIIFYGKTDMLLAADSDVLARLRGRSESPASSKKKKN